MKSHSRFDPPSSAFAKHIAKAAAHISTDFQDIKFKVLIEIPNVFKQIIQIHEKTARVCVLSAERSSRAPEEAIIHVWQSLIARSENVLEAGNGCLEIAIRNSICISQTDRVAST